MHFLVVYLPKGEYSLSDKGLSMFPIIDEMCRWGKK
ncbi:MAG: winged helix-turn-helix transcriptional regulator [Lachnotalea sp.]